MATATTTITATTTKASATPSVSSGSMASTPVPSPGFAGKVTFAELSKLPFPRKCVSKLGEVHWPCLYFPNFEVMIQELDEFIKNKDPQNEFFDHEDLNEFGLAFLEAMTKDDQANTQPVLHWIGTGEVTFNPSEEEILHFAYGTLKMVQDGRNDSELAAAVQMAKDLYANFKGPTKRKRKAMRISSKSPKLAAIHAKQANVSTKTTTCLTTAISTSAAVPATPKLATMDAANEASPTVAAKPMNIPEPTGITDVSNPVTAAASNEAPVATAVPNFPPKVPAVEAYISTKTPAPTQLKSPPALLGRKLLAEAKKTYAGVGPLVLSPEATVDTQRQNSTGHQVTVDPAEYRKLQGGRTMQEFADSVVEEQEAAAKAEGRPNDRGVSPSEFRCFQGGPDLKEFAQRLADGEAKVESESSQEMDVSEGASTTPVSAAASEYSTTKRKGPGRPRNAFNNAKKTPGSRHKNRIVKGPTPPLANTTLDDPAAEDADTPPSGYMRPDTTMDISEENRVIPTFHDVKPLLSKLGFLFVGMKGFDTSPEYRLPSYKKAERRVGENFFTSEETFRAHLCAHGLGEGARSRLEGATKSEAETKQLERWVRLSIVKDLEPGKLEESMPTWKAPIKPLVTLGFNGWKYSCPLVKENDGVWKSEDQGVRQCLVEGELFEKVSRFGLPKECHFDRISREDRRRLEITFSLRDRDWIEPVSLNISNEARAGRRKRSEALEQAESNASGKKQKREKGKMAVGRAQGEKATSASKKSTKSSRKEPSSPVEDPVVVDVEMSSPLRKNEAALQDGEKECKDATPNQPGKGDPKPTTSDNVKEEFQSDMEGEKTFDRVRAKLGMEADCEEASSHESVEPLAKLFPSTTSSPAVYDKDALADCNRMPTEEGAPKPISGRRNIDAEMQRSDDQEKLKSCLKSLRDVDIVDDVGTGIVFGAKDSHFRKNAYEFYELVDGLVRSRLPNSRGALKSKPSALYLCGSPGIGKTTAVKWSCHKVMKMFTDDDGEFKNLGIEPAFVDINCTQMSAGGTDVRKKVLADIWEACGASANSKGCDDAKLMRMLSMNGDYGKKRFVFLVLDEIDNLVNPNFEGDVAKGAGEKFIEELCGWIKRPINRLVVIGIGNAMNNNKYRRIEKFLQFHKSMMFQSYQENEIESILKEKVKGHSIVDPKAVSFIAKKVANVKGDARQAIEMLSTAITSVQERAQEQPNSGAQQPGPYLVGMKDVIRLNSDLMKLTEIIGTLPSIGKLVICAAVRLARENQSNGCTIKLTRRDLLNATSKLLQEKLPEDSVDESDINQLISRLHDNGIADIDTIWGVEDDDPIVFNHMVPDLEAAVEETLKGSIFAI